MKAKDKAIKNTNIKRKNGVDTVTKVAFCESFRTAVFDTAKRIGRVSKGLQSIIFDSNGLRQSIQSRVKLRLEVKKSKS